MTTMRLKKKLKILIIKNLYLKKIMTIMRLENKLMRLENKIKIQMIKKLYRKKIITIMRLKNKIKI